jgi:hypothetical protein
MEEACLKKREKLFQLISILFCEVKRERLLNPILQLFNVQNLLSAAELASCKL